MQNLFSNDSIRSPLGRNNSRKSQQSLGSSDASSRRYSSEDAREQIIEYARIQQQTMATIAEEANKRTMLKAFKFLLTPIPPKLPPDDYGLRLQQQSPTLENDESDNN